MKKPTIAELLKVITPDMAIADHDEFAFNIGDTGITIDQIPVLDEKEALSINQYVKGENFSLNNTCTIAGAYVQRCHLFGIKPTQKELEAYVQYAIDNLGYDPAGGRQTRLGVDAVRKKHNADHPDKKFISAVITEDDDRFEIFLQRNHMIGATYQGNKEYNTDYLTDGVIEGSNYKPAQYGHRINAIKSKNAAEINIVDQMFGLTKFNRYAINHFKDLIKNKVFYVSFFVFVPENLSSETIEQITARKIQEKTLQTLLFTLSVCHDTLPADVQPLVASLASTIKPLVKKETLGMPTEIKAAQAFTFFGSFIWNLITNLNLQGKLSEVVSEFRKTYGVE